MERPSKARNHDSFLSPGIRLLLASFLALFLELALIRFIPAYVRAIGYYTNLVLIASFFGLGLGFLSARRRSFDALLLPLVLINIATVWFLTKAIALNSNDTDEPLWLFAYDGTQSFEIPLTALVLVVFVVVAAGLLPVGQLMGRLFGQLPRLKAYAYDLGGSLLGTITFGVLSALETSPLVWFGVVIVITLLIAGRSPIVYAANLASGIGVVVLLIIMGTHLPIWSPYYKVEVDRTDPSHKTLLTNGTLHQVMLDFDDTSSYINSTRDRFRIPYELASSLDSVLIVGAGTGNDVAIAQKMGAKHIDAVEIDPVFPRIGLEEHPQKPYAADNVTLTIADARSYFRQTERKYDLIVFGTLDSQALLSGLSSIRLDNYIYTVNAFRDAYGLLKPDGMLAVFHMSIKPHIADRIFLLLAEVGGRPPLYLHFSDHTLFNKLFIQGKNVPMQNVPAEFIDRLRNETIPTDDWPFLYLREPGIPSHYTWVLVGMLLITLLGTAAFSGGRLRHFDASMFFLGAGFLLLETRSVTQMSLLFGSTWVVNLLVFSSILAVLFLANAFIIRRSNKDRPLSIPLLFMLLLGSLLLLSLVPVSLLGSLPTVLRWLGAGLYVGLPISIAGLLFPLLFARSRDPQAAFGSNLLGAIAGGVTEYLTMLAGISSLTIAAAVFYLCTFLFVRRTLRKQ